MWDSIPFAEVCKLPEGIDGLVKYNIVNAKTSKEVSSALLADGRKWKKSNVTQWKKKGEMRYSDCKGSFRCINAQCPFRVQFGVTNTRQFKNGSNNDQACSVCGDAGEFVACTARRYVNYGKRGVQVFHCGNHTCPVTSRREKPTERVKEMIKKHPRLKPAEIQSAFVLSSLRTEEDWEKVEKEAAQLLDRKWISNQKQSVRQEIHPSGENFEAVVTFKQYCDKKDSLLIFKVNDRRGNPDKPSFVFKTSDDKMKTALNMDRNGEHFLQEEYCFFDGKVKRCRDFVTLTASVYHPLLKRQIPLAVMETEQENSENIALFWTLFNEGLRKVSGDNNAVFNPLGWCTDMAGANMNGLRQVFGDDALSRIKSCEFHFKESRNRMARKLGQEAGETFKDLCENLLTCNLKETYLEVKKSLEEFINEKPERQFLSSWLSWWDNRRTFIFGAFAPTHAPQMNQAEVIHAGWAHKDPSNLSLLDAAHTDTKDSVLLAVELMSIKQGTSKGGTGPSYEERRTKMHRREVGRAAQLGEEIMRVASENGLLVDPNSGHRPPENKTTRKRKQQKRTEAQSSATSLNSQQQNVSNSGFSSQQTQRPDGAKSLQIPQAFASVQSNSALQSSELMQLRFLPTTSHHMEHPLATLMGPSYDHHHPPTLTGGRTVQQHDPSTTGQDYWQPARHSAAEGWHSGYSPHRYELVTLPGNVRKCYGCGAEFTERHRNSPNNIVVKHVDRRLVRRDEHTGQFLYSADYSNTYYHLDFAHIQRKNPFFNGQVFIAFDKLRSFDYAQCDMIENCNLHVTVI